MRAVASASPFLSSLDSIAAKVSGCILILDRAVRPLESRPYLHINHVGLAFAVEMGQGLLVAHWAVLLFAKGLEAYPNYGMLCREGVMQQ